jgi:internalin A
MSAETVTRPWLRLLRFSVRALLVIVLVIGVGLGWTVRQAQVQRDAVAAIKSAGGRVYYDWEWRIATKVIGGRPWAPAWLLDCIGVDFFGHIVRVEGPASMTQSDAVMAAIGRLTRIQFLWINQVFLTDADLALMAKMNTHRGPLRSDGQITGEGLAVHDSIGKLSYLQVSGTPQATDAGLAHLKGLRELSCLALIGTQVTDTGLAHLTGLRNLSLLLLQGTGVSDAGVKKLQQSLPELWILH